MSREIHRHHGVFGSQSIDLRVPIVGVARPAVYEHDGRLAFSPDAIIDMHAVWSEGELWEAFDVRRLGNGAYPREPARRSGE